jgi:transposase
MSDEWLNDARKIPDEVMSYIRKLAVHAVVERGHSPDVAANVIGVSRSSLFEWLKKYQRGGYDELDTRDAPGAEPLIVPEMDIWLKSVVLKENPTNYGYDTVLWSCPILAEILEKTFGVKVIASTVNAHLKKLDLSYQKPCYVAREQDPAEIEYFLNEKFPRIQRLAIKIGADIAFEDESGVDLSDRSGRTWGLAGETPKIKVTGQRGKFNVLSVVTRDGDIEYEVTKDHIDSEAYIDFLEKVLDGRDRPLIVLLDHASFHHSKKVRSYVRDNRKRIRVYFLPKYSPEYNPTEQVWEELKENQIGRQPVYDSRDLKKRLLSALKALKANAERIKSFFAMPHTKYALA